MEDELDTHICLACNQTIEGLMNYVVHKKSQCQKRRSGLQPQPQQQPDQASYNSDQQLFDQPLRAGSSGPSHRGTHQNELLGAASRGYGLRSQDNVMLSSLQQPSNYGRRHSGYGQQQNSQNSAAAALTGGGPNASASLSVDVSSPLSSFIDSAFSPDDDDGPVDPNSVLNGQESPRSRPDFFQSLELKSITGEEKAAAGSQGRNLRSRKRGLQEDTLDLDLPITMILSNLDFSSDEEENGVFFLSTKAYKIHCAGGTHQACLSKLGANAKLELQVCPHCSMKFSDEESYELHVEFVHLHVSTEEAVQRVCQGRDMVTQLYGEHLRQLDSISHDSSVSCPECGKFFSKNNLIEHLRTHTGERPFKCRHCTRDFGSRISLRRHLLEHIGKSSFTCETCGKVFKKRQQYTLHQHMHVSEKKGLKFDCEVCGASFLLERQLVHHKKRHGERKFKCTVPGCHWTFVLKPELEQHMTTHTKEKKYLCDICGWGAYSTTNLRRHAKTHQPAKEIPCEYCPYKAGCKTHLKRHMRIHIGAKPFKCLYCTYACNTHENMRKHILKTRKHKGLKIYPCKFCGYQSNEAKDFRSHLMQDHMDYVKSRPSESLVKFTGLYHPEEDITQPPEGSEIHQVMKGRFMKVYDGTRIGGTGDPVAPPGKKRKVRRNNQSVQAEQEDISEDTTTVKADSTASNEQIPVLTQDIVDTSGAPVSLVTQQQQQPLTVTIQQADGNVYPRGLPWTVVAQDSQPGNWCQSMDVVVPHSVTYRAPQAVQVVGNTAGGTAYVNTPGSDVPTILTMVNVDRQTFQQMEASGYQVIATGGTTISQCP
nr:hypothetical protein BaRGS_003795 [Batillaria attramentaria]